MIGRDLFDKNPHICVVNVTPEKAEEWLSYEFDGQRKTDEGRVRTYAVAMSAGQWRGGDGLIVIGMVGDTRYLIAGKHRLSAVVMSKSTIQMRVEWRSYSGHQSLLADYSSTNNGKNLTMGQALSALGTDSAIGINSGEIRAASSAVGVIANSFARNKLTGPAVILQSPSVRDRVLRDWQAPIYGYCKAKNHSFKGQDVWFTRAAVMAVGLVTFRFQPEKAEEFWRTTADGTGLHKLDPQHHLRNFLSTTSPARDETQAYSMKIARCWNAFYDGRTIDRIVVGSIPVGNMLIEGTPFNGKREVDTLALLGIK